MNSRFGTLWATIPDFSDDLAAYLTYKFGEDVAAFVAEQAAIAPKASKASVPAFDLDQMVADAQSSVKAHIDLSVDTHLRCMRNPWYSPGPYTTVVSIPGGFTGSNLNVTGTFGVDGMVTHSELLTMSLSIVKELRGYVDRPKPTMWTRIQDYLRARS